MQTPGLPRTLYFHQSPLVTELQEWTKVLASSVLEMPLETEINVPHIHKKQFTKINVTCLHICILMHICMYTPTHIHTNWITNSNIATFVTRTEDLKPTGSKKFSPLLHREVLLSSPWPWKLSQKLECTQSLHLQEICSPFPPCRSTYLIS